MLFRHQNVLFLLLCSWVVVAPYGSLAYFHPTSPLARTSSQHVHLVHPRATVTTDESQSLTRGVRPSPRVVSLSALGHHLHLHLRHNTELFHPDYVEEHMSADGSVTRVPLHETDHFHCHFAGRVAAVSNRSMDTQPHVSSHVRVNLCEGISGVLYHPLVGRLAIEPAHKHVKHVTDPRVHAVWRPSDVVLSTEEKEARAGCAGTADGEPRAKLDMTPEERAYADRLYAEFTGAERPGSASRTLLQSGSSTTTYYIPIIAVSDEFLLAEQGAGTTSLVADIIARVDAVFAYNTRYSGSAASAMRVQLKRQIVLVDNVFAGLSTNETGSDCFDKDEFIDFWGGWMQANIITSWDEGDMPHLFTARDICGTTVGYATVEAICLEVSRRRAISQMYTSSIDQLVTLVAHELGHNVGFDHDGDEEGNGADCDPATDGLDCAMMEPSVCTTGEPELTWSSCSVGTFWLLHIQRFVTNNQCLPTSRGLTWDDPRCGNGIIEGNEECDCGGSDCGAFGDECCNGATCTLVASAACNPAVDSCCAGTCQQRTSPPQLGTGCAHELLVLFVRQQLLGGVVDPTPLSLWFDFANELFFSFEVPYTTEALLFFPIVTSPAWSTVTVSRTVGNTITAWYIGHAQYSSPVSLPVGVTTIRVSVNIDWNNGNTYSRWYTFTVTRQNEEIPLLRLASLEFRETPPAGTGKGGVGPDSFGVGNAPVFSQDTFQYALTLDRFTEKVRVKATLAEAEGMFPIQLHASFAGASSWTSLSDGSLSPEFTVPLQESSVLLVRIRYAANTGVIDVLYSLTLEYPDASALLASLRVFEIDTSSPSPTPESELLPLIPNFSNTFRDFFCETERSRIRVEAEVETVGATMSYVIGLQNGFSSSGSLATEALALPIGTTQFVVSVVYQSRLSTIAEGYTVHVQRVRPDPPSAALSSLRMRTRPGNRLYLMPFSPQTTHYQVSVHFIYDRAQVSAEAQDSRADVYHSHFSPLPNDGTWSPLQGAHVPLGLSKWFVDVIAEAETWTRQQQVYEVAVLRQSSVTRVDLYDMDTQQVLWSSWSRTEQLQLVSVDATVARVRAKVFIAQEANIESTLEGRIIYDQADGASVPFNPLQAGFSDVFSLGFGPENYVQIRVAQADTALVDVEPTTLVHTLHLVRSYPPAESLHWDSFVVEAQHTDGSLDVLQFDPPITLGQFAPNVAELDGNHTALFVTLTLAFPDQATAILSDTTKQYELQSGVRSAALSLGQLLVDIENDIGALQARYTLRFTREISRIVVTGEGVGQDVHEIGPTNVGHLGGQFVNGAIRFSNGGSGPLIFWHSIGGPHEYDFSPPPAYTIESPNHHISMRPTFKPTRPGVRRATWFVHTNDPGTPLLSFQVQGVGVAAEAQCGNGQIEAGEKCDKFFESWSGGELYPGCIDCQVEPGYSCVITTVQLDLGAGGHRECTLQSGASAAVPLPDFTEALAAGESRKGVHLDFSGELAGVSISISPVFAPGSVLHVEAHDAATASQFPVPPGADVSDVYLNLTLGDGAEGNFDDGPVTLRIQADCTDEPQLLIFNETTMEWADAATTCGEDEYLSECVDGLLEVNVCHFTTFGVFGGGFTLCNEGDDGACGECGECVNGACEAIEDCCVASRDCGKCSLCAVPDGERVGTCEEVDDCCLREDECGGCEECAPIGSLGFGQCAAVDGACCESNEDCDGPCQSCAIARGATTGRCGQAEGCCFQAPSRSPFDDIPCAGPCDTCSPTRGGIDGEGVCRRVEECCASDRECVGCETCQENERDGGGTCVSQCSVEQHCVRDACVSRTARFFEAPCGCESIPAVGSGPAADSVTLTFDPTLEGRPCVGEPVQL